MKTVTEWTFESSRAGPIGGRLVPKRVDKESVRVGPGFNSLYGCGDACPASVVDHLQNDKFAIGTCSSSRAKSVQIPLTIRQRTW